MSSGALGRKIKTALGETRLLILGAQILFGFHFNAAFQDGFPGLALPSRYLHTLAFFAMACTIGCLIAPSMQHRLVERGHATTRMLRVTTRFAAAALVLFALALGMDLYIVVEHRFGLFWGLLIGIGLGTMALLFWYGAEWMLRPSGRKEDKMPSQEDTPLEARVEQMLTEARVLIPGAQALFGFQLGVMLMDAFGQLPATAKAVHTAALCCIVIAIILLMAPAAFHRVTFGGQDTEEFYRLGSRLVVAGAVPLAAGIAADLDVAIQSSLGSQPIAMAVAIVVGLVLAGLWFIYPLVLRAKLARTR